MSKAVFHTHIFEYETRTSALMPHRQANATNCPAGRVLTETGKQLRPGITPGVTVLMVSVFDEVSMIRGFIHAGLKDIYQPYDPRGLEDIKRSMESKKRDDEARIELERKKAELVAIELAIQKRTAEDTLLDEVRVKKRADELRQAEIESVRWHEEEARVNKSREVAETRKMPEAESIAMRKNYETEIMRKHAETARIKAEEEAAAQKKAEEEAAARKKAEEEAAARKKAEEEAAARRKAEEEAAARKKAEEEAAARKKAEEEAAARAALKKAEEEAAARAALKKAEEEAATRAALKKAEEEAAARAALAVRKKAEEEAVRRIAEQEEIERKLPILSTRFELPSHLLSKYIDIHSQLVSSYQDVLIGKRTENVVKIKAKDGKATCSPYAFENTILNIIHYSNFKISGSAPGESKIVHFVITNFSGGAIHVDFEKTDMLIENEFSIDIPGKQERTCIISCYSDGEKMIEYARSKPLFTPKNSKF